MNIGIRPELLRKTYTNSAKIEEQTTEETTATAEKQEGVSLSIKIDKWESKPNDFSDMQTGIIPKEQLETIRQTLKEMSGKLEYDEKASLRNMVDPEGKLYGAAFVEGIVKQYQEMETQIKDYYSKAHKENLSYEDPYRHIRQKYLADEKSSFFKADMPQAERDWALRQERAMLWGSHVALNDPYALAAHGGVKHIDEIDANARQYAQSKLDQLIAEYQREHGIANN